MQEVAAASQFRHEELPAAWVGSPPYERVQREIFSNTFTSTDQLASLSTNYLASFGTVTGLCELVLRVVTLVKFLKKTFAKSHPFARRPISRLQCPCWCCSHYPHRQR